MIDSNSTALEREECLYDALDFVADVLERALLLHTKHKYSTESLIADVQVCAEVADRAVNDVINYKGKAD